MAAAAAEVLLEPELKKLSKMRLNLKNKKYSNRITQINQTFFSTPLSVA